MTDYFMKNAIITPEGAALRTRRQFIKTSSAAAMAGIFAANLSFPEKTFAANTDTIKIGLVGCGGRGSGAALNALMADPNVVLVAMGDAFEDRLKSSLANLKGNKEAGARVQVDPDHCFVGLDAYKKVLDSGIDLIILATPPGFRPMHLKTAVEANKHIFTEKPMATDAAGVRSVMETVKLAKEKKLAMVAGFCWRYNYGERAGVKLIHEGAIGDIRAIYSTYNTGTLWSYPRKEGWTDLESQMRNWYYFTWLGGDHLVEQAVHSVDKMIWAMNDVAPVRAIAHGGRQVRTSEEFGHIYDHFEVVYDFPNGAKGFMFCRQIDNCSNDNSDTIMGTKGVARINGFRKGPDIRGEKNWDFEGPRPDMYQVEHNELFASIRAGKPNFDGDWMIQTTLMAIMGRMAAYTGQSITWEEALNSKENLMPTLDWNAKIPTPAVAMPGKYPLI